MTRVFIQARMSSRRFPGKVLHAVAGRPILQRLIDTVTAVVSAETVSILTSVESSDAPVVAFAEHAGVRVFRGPLEDVFARFRGALAEMRCDRFVRLSADSPLLPGPLLRHMLDVPADADIVTNVHPRTFPKGWSVEVIDTAAFEAVAGSELSDHDREHVTPYFYAHADRYRIRNVRAGRAYGDLSLAIDSPEDLARVERMLEDGRIPQVTFA